MKRLHVLIVTRRYWPHCDDATTRLTALVSGLRRQGCFPTVLVPRYQSSWPTEIQHREIPILRPLVAPRGEWSMGRYIRNLGKWLRVHLSRFDVAYCDLMREESAAVVETARRINIPCVVRCGSLLGANDIVWQASLRSRHTVFSQSFAADAVIAPRASSQQGLLAAGAKANVIVRIADGLGDPIRRTNASRDAARVALEKINHDLRVPANGHVILCMNRLSPEGGVFSLVSSIWPVLERRPNLRLWLIGDGQWRSKIYSELRSNGAGKSAFMPGSFDHVEDLMHAADLFVLPSASNGVESFWPSAIAAGLPTVVGDCADTRAFASNLFPEIHSFPPDSTSMMRQKIQDVLDNLDGARRSADQLRNRMAALAPWSETIQRHVQLFERLTSTPAVHNVGGATG